MSRRLTKEDKQALLDRDWWQRFERDGWKLHGFTFRVDALFVKYDERGNGRSLNVTRDHLELLAAPVSDIPSSTTSPKEGA